VPYPELMVKPMRDELVAVGFQELRTVDEVEGFLADRQGSALLFINSVCGCAAGQARPGVRAALEHGVTPDRLGTVFAGQDVEAAARARQAFADIPPSSPSIALFKDGDLAYFVPRHRIENRSAQEVAADLVAAFERYCAVSAAS
jgi:bacilliredoxin